MNTRMIATVLCLSLGGCAGDDDPHDHHDHDHDHGTEDMNLTREAMTDGGTWMLSYTPSIDPIVTSENFTLTLSVDSGPTEDIRVEFDAMMPAHNHGMNTEAVVTENEDGTYTVDGMLFHMPGHWRMMADVYQADSVETAIFDVEL